MKKIVQQISLFMASFGLVGVLALSPVAVGALDVTEKGSQSESNDALTNKANQEETLTVLIGRIISTILFLLGIAAVIIIILAGFRYVTAQGDAGATKTARNTILYACIGLVVAILSYAIVGFVLARFAGNGS